jgi:rubrerythrin
MSEHHEGHSAAYENIRARKTVAEVLAVATSFEASARDFYTALIPRVSKNLRYLVEELAAEEQRHFDMFTELANNPAIQDQVQQRIRTPVEDNRFSDYITLPDLGDQPDDQRILQYALGREDAAMKQYRELAETTPPGPVRSLFAYLANEETGHKLELEKLYYETVYSGGPGNG